MQYFRECYHDFPKGKVVNSESPDFIITLKSKNNIGIELTRLNPINVKEPDHHETDQNQIRENIIYTAQSLFKQSSGLKLFTKFLFSNNTNIPLEKELITAAQVTDVIRKAVVNRHSDSFFRESVPISNLPDGLEALLIIHHPELKVNLWERSNNLGISGNVIEDIRETIHKKDEKLRLYQKQHLNYYWLLITTDRLRGIKNYNLPDKIMNHSFHSRFQHVFLFDLIKSDIYQLV